MKNTLSRYFLLIVTILTFGALAYSQVCETSATGGICGPYNYPDVTGNDGNNVNVQNGCWNTGGYCNGSDQTLYSTNPGSWYAVANFPSGNLSVQSYPNSDYYNVDTLVTSYSSMYSSIAESMGTIPSGSSAEAGFDIINMTNTGTSWNEVMIWNDVNNRGFGGCDSWPPYAQVQFGGSNGVPVNTWDLWECGTSELIWQLDAGSSPPTHYGFQSGSVDIHAMMMWLINNGYLGTGTTFGQIEYGFEICSTGGVNQTFTVSGWTLTSTAGAQSPTISLSPTSLGFSGTAGGSNPAMQDVNVSNVGGGTLATPTTTIAYGSGSGWLTANVSGSSSPYTVSVQPNISGLAAGTYTATVSVASSGASNTPQSISVTLAVSASSGVQQVNLSSAYNRIGMYTDGTTFSSTGGDDLHGSAYSATLLGTSQTWSGTTFTLGPANASNDVGGAGQTITLPAGEFSGLQMLATGAYGNQPSQTITVTYTDLTTSTFTQGFSDWYTPQNYSGESEAVTLAYNDTYAGGRSNQTYHLYGYSFTLNSSKTVKSVTLPNDTYVNVLAMALTGGSSSPSISLSPTSLTFNGTSGGSNPAAQDVTVSNSGGGTLAAPTTTITYGSGNGWLTVNESGSEAPYTLAVQPSLSGLAVGTYTATVKVASSGANNTPQSFSVTLIVSSGPTQVNLSSAFNRIGMYTDGTTFSSTGGDDLHGNAYSATLLGSSQTWNGETFNLGPANASNDVGGAGQTITLPSGNYSTLRMLATGAYGNQPSKTITVTYTDLTTSTFTQGFSDWFTPQSYSGESEAVTLAYNDTYAGGRSNQTYHLYGYSFAINNAKTVKSVTLPNDTYVNVLAITLVP